MAVQGGFQTRENVPYTFARQSEIQGAQLALEDMLRLQIDEEDSVRAYVLNGDSFYKDQYDAAAASFDERESIVAGALKNQSLVSAQTALHDYVALQNEWRTQIATPMLTKSGQSSEEMDKRSKAFSDYQNASVERIRSVLADRNAALAQAASGQVNSGMFLRAFWLLVFGLSAILFNSFRSRLSQELEEEKMTTEVLQKAFRSEHVPIRNCEVGSAYLSAGSHLAVGGDVFDVYRLSDDLALLLIADVSGKGVDAAVITAFIKFTIRGIALRRRDPGSILQEFNTAFAQTVENPYLFVSMLVGVLDTQTLELRYASAGHDSAFIRSASGVHQMAVTGPVLGVMEEPFGVKVVYLEEGDTIVLATDGLTEARDRTGEQLHEEGAMRLIAASSEKPQLLADELVAQVRALGGNEARDDLAVLVVRVHESEVGK
jgi:sigma-B regulation protein RsbU (phosphoserine phosphatase)